ncbi:MAG TPA: TIGR03620 family F420-dependent LLM class oxidoreductase [Candidatus Binataceae bacterium]
MEIGKLGVWSILDAMKAPDSAAFARKVEQLGYSAMWIPEAVGREPFAHAGFLAGHTERVIIATGIANIWARDPMTMMAGARSVAEISGGRFVLGIGVSHEPLVRVRGRDFVKPYSYMREYLPKMKSALYMAVKPKEEPPIVIGALHPKMLALAAEQTHGTHTYFVPPEHTAKARAMVGPKAWICTAQAVVLEADPAIARDVARDYMKTYTRLPNYANMLKALGFTDADFADGGSDRLVDAVVAWGNEDKLRERIAAHHRAGATHVCILPLRTDKRPLPDERTIEALAPGN